jgi:hypothetical protein
MTLGDPMKKFFITFLLLAAAGCATSEKDQCESGDWFEIGRKDGREGKLALTLFKSQIAKAESPSANTAIMHLAPIALMAMPKMPLDIPVSNKN